jgi:hypothetical protein
MRRENALRTFLGCAILGLCLVVTAGEMNDSEHFRWDIQHDGSIGDGNNDTFDGGSHLVVNGQRFRGGQQNAGLDEREVVIGPQNTGGVNVTRKIRVSNKMAGCRYLEILENTTQQPIQVQVSLYTNVGNSVQGSVLPDSKDGFVHYVAIDQGQGGARCLAYCMATAKSKFRVRPQTHGDDVTLAYQAITLKPNQRTAILHVIAQRNSVMEAEEYAKKLRWSPILRELDKKDRALICNVRAGGGLLSVAGVELFRGEGGDAVRLNSGELLTGRLQTPTIAVKTEFGDREVAAAQVLSLFNAGSGVRLVCQNGEVLTGKPTAPTLKLKLKGGKVVDIPMAVVAKYGKQMPKAKQPGDNNEPEAVEQFTFTDPVFILRSGDRLVGKLKLGKLELNTLYGPIALAPGELKRIQFPHAELRAPVVELKDGSSFAALPNQREWTLVSASGGEVTLNPGRLHTVLFTPSEVLAEEKEEQEANAFDDVLPPAHAQLRLLNGDLFCGKLTNAKGQVTLLTPFGQQTLGLDQIMRLKPRTSGTYNVRISLWDGNVFPARWERDTIGFTTNGGAKLEVPFGLLDLYWRPLALPPAEEAGRITALINQLGDNDPKIREDAQKALLEKGHGTRALLAKHWNDEDLEKRTRVRRILEKLQENAPQETLEDEEDEDQVNGLSRPDPTQESPFC